MTNTLPTGKTSWGGAECTLINNVLTINTGKGNVVIDTNKSTPPWKNNGVDVTKITEVNVLGSISFTKNSSLRQLFYIFSNCESFDGLENFNTSNVTSMGEMFYKCSSLNSLNLSNWNTSNVKYMQSMFIWCSSLNYLDISCFSLINISDITGMLQNLNNLETIITPYQFDKYNYFQTQFIINLQNRFKECDTGKLVDDTTIIKPSFIYTNNETLISNTRKLCGSIVNILN